MRRRLLILLIYLVIAIASFGAGAIVLILSYFFHGTIKYIYIFTGITDIIVSILAFVVIFMYNHSNSEKPPNKN